MNDDELLAAVPPMLRPMVEQVMALRGQLSTAEVTATDSTELITAVVDLYGNVRRIEFHPTARRRLDNLTLGDHVRDAVNAAVAKAQAEYRATLDGVNVFGMPLGQLRADPRAAARKLIADGTVRRPG